MSLDVVKVGCVGDGGSDLGSPSAAYLLRPMTVAPDGRFMMLQYVGG